jgi:hypothetical protein
MGNGTISGRFQSQTDIKINESTGKDVENDAEHDKLDSMGVALASVVVFIRLVFAIINAITKLTSGNFVAIVYTCPVVTGERLKIHF